MPDLDRIRRECFWETTMTPQDILRMARAGNREEKRFIFEKILLNSTHLLNDISIFDLDDLKELVENYKLPQFNREHAAKRKNLVEVFFFDKDLVIDELLWVT